jgi:hypothetical protein
VHFHAELIVLHLLMRSYVIGVSQLNVIVVHNICVPVSGVVSQFQEPSSSFTSVTLLDDTPEQSDFASGTQELL